MTFMLSIELPDELAETLLLLADTEGMTMQEILLDALDHYLELYEDDIAIIKNNQNRETQGIPNAS